MGLLVRTGKTERKDTIRPLKILLILKLKNEPPREVSAALLLDQNKLGGHYDTLTFKAVL